MSFLKKKPEDRLYQTRIFESAKDKNTLVVLPTGLGKTIISIMLADYRLEKFKGSKVLFVAPTKPLINQHYKTFSGMMDCTLGIVSGETGKSKREVVYRENDIVFATPQTIENDMNDGTIEFSDFSLLVVDEAHHAIGNYAYVELSKNYSASSKHPLITGLTASPASDKSKISLICKNLNISNVEIRSEEDDDVLPYINKKVIKEVRVELPTEIKDLLIELKKYINDQLSQLQGSGLLKGVAISRINRRTILSLQSSLQKQLLKGRKSFYVFRGLTITAKLMKLYHAYNLLATQSLSAFDRFMSKIVEEGSSRADKELANSKEISEVREKATKLLENGVENPKLFVLRDILKSELSGDQLAIIFTQYRDSVDTIFDFVKAIPGARPVKFIGQGKGGLSQKDQINIIKDFESGVYNALISTSVSEEGISIKGADLAVFYETVPSAIRAIQRRGRVGRFSTAEVYVLIAKDTNDEGYHWIAKRKEARMKKIVKEIKDNPELIRNDGTLTPFT